MKKQSRIRKLWSLLLYVMVIVAGIPAAKVSAATSDGQAVGYQVYIQGVEVTSEKLSDSAAGWVFTPPADYDDVAKLTLTNAKIKGDASTFTKNGIESRIPLEIVLNGNNTVEGAENSGCGIAITESLYISGSGKLNVGNAQNSCAISTVWGNLVLSNGAQVYAVARGDSGSGMGINVINGTLMMEENSSLSVKCGPAKQGGDSYSVGIFAASVIMEDGSVLIAEGGTCGIAVMSDYFKTAGQKVVGGEKESQLYAVSWDSVVLSPFDAYTYKYGNGLTAKYIHVGTAYKITVNGGKASDSMGTGITETITGMKISLTADAAPEGQKFAGWTVESGDVALADSMQTTTTFVMPRGNVKISAKFVPDGAQVGTTATVAGAQYNVTSSDAKTGVYTVTFKKSTNKKKASVTIPETVTINGKVYKVTGIAANAFKKHTKLKSVKIGKNVQTIGERAFYKCTSLKKITIPSGVNKIGKQAFYGCKNLKKITIKTTKLTNKKVGKQAFKGIYKKAVIKVPKSKLKAYKKLLKNKGIGKEAKVKK